MFFSLIIKLSNFIECSLSFFFKGITFDWRDFFSIEELSTSKSNYEPPCKSKPRLIFFFKKELFASIKFKIANILTKKKTKYMNIIFVLEKFSTKKLFFNFFF